MDGDYILEHAIRVAVWKDGSLFQALWPYFQKLEAQGILEVAYILQEQDEKIAFFPREQMYSGGGTVNGVFLPADMDYWPLAEKLIQAGIPQKSIWNARAVLVDGMDWKRFLADRTVVSRMKDAGILPFSDNTFAPYRREYRNICMSVHLGYKANVGSALLEGHGTVNIGNFANISWEVVFELGLNNSHDYNRVFTYDVLNHWPIENTGFRLIDGEINIGADAWIARGCRLKAAGTKPLTIGTGAVVAADSVVVSDVPPFAIVGGNPAKFIKWRFPEEIRQKLSQIRWWDWSLEKIYHCRHDLLDPKKFVEKYYQPS